MPRWGESFTQMRPSEILARTNVEQIFGVMHQDGLPSMRFAQREGCFLFPTTLRGVLVFDSVIRVASLPRPASHVSHTIFVHHLCQPPSFTHHLSHTISHTPSLSTIFCQPPSFTHHLSHTSLSTTIFHTPCWSTTLRGRRGSHPPWFCVAGVALMALGGALGPVLVADDAAALCVAGVALGHIHRSFHLAGVAQSHIHLFSPLFCVAGVALMALGGALGPGLVADDAAALCVALGHTHRSFHVAGVSQSHIHLGFAWQAWHSWHWVARLGPF